MQIWSVQ